VAVSIVVPVRNEADNVAPLIAEIAAALDGRWTYEIIYVNDGSTDATADRLATLMKARNLRQIRHAGSAGQSRGGGSGPRRAPSWRRSTATARTIRRSAGSDFGDRKGGDRIGLLPGSGRTQGHRLQEDAVAHCQWRAQRDPARRHPDTGCA
jgi:glycosyltransferase involved in cell wall biosynthesis